MIKSRKTAVRSGDRGTAETDGDLRPAKRTRIEKFGNYKLLFSVFFFFVISTRETIDGHWDFVYTYLTRWNAHVGGNNNNIIYTIVVVVFVPFSARARDFRFPARVSAKIGKTSEKRTGCGEQLSSRLMLYTQYNGACSGRVSRAEHRWK